MNKIKAYLNQPYPAYRKPWVIVLVATLLVFFVLVLFQPFGIANNPNSFWFVAIGFTLVTTISTSLVGYIFPFVFRRFYNKENWTVGKNILNNFIIVFIIGIGNFLFDWTITNRNPETFWQVLSVYLIITFLVGIIPALVNAFIIQNSSLKENLKHAKEINKRLLERAVHTISTSQDDPVISLSGTTKETIELHPDDILYLEASGNYVNINYLINGLVKQKKLRATIAKMEKDLDPYPFLIRSHRAFIVNTNYIVSTEGNAQGFQLSLRHTTDEVPVSRTYTGIIRRKLQESL